MYVIIIAGSLPTLRPFVERAIAMSKNRSSSKKTYQQYPHTPARHSHALKPYNIKHSHHHSRLPTNHSDSDQDILGPGITKTTDIAVDYDARKVNSDKRQIEWESQGNDFIETVHAIGASERV